ncbi:MAG: TolC family protein [Limnobacter sp.]|nr:TolC family protein [Limnobacter sp.]
MAYKPHPRFFMLRPSPLRAHNWARALTIGLLAVVVLGLAPRHAQAADTLLTLLPQAQQTDKVWRSAQAQFKADQERTPQALSALLPGLSFGAQFQQQDTTRTASNQSIDSSNNPRAYALTLSQALFRPQAWKNYEQSQLATEAASLVLSQARQELILRLASACFEVLKARNALQTISVQQEAIAGQLESAKRNFEVGTATITDQQEAQARYDLSQAQKLAAKNRLAIAHLELERITGQSTLDLAALRSDSTLSAPNPPDAESWAQAAAENNLQTRQAELAKHIAERETSKARYGHLPTLDLKAEYVNAEQQVLNGITPLDAEQESRTLSLLLNVPLFSGGLTQSQVRQQGALTGKSPEQPGPGP